MRQTDQEWANQAVKAMLARVRQMCIAELMRRLLDLRGDVR